MLGQVQPKYRGTKTISADQARSRLWSDNPVDNPSADHFSFQDYAVVLAERLTRMDTTFTLGIFGKWGSGKTSLMHLLRRELTIQNPAHRRFATLWINAWLLSTQDDLGLAFLETMFLDLRGRIGLFKRIVFDTSLLFDRVDWEQVFRQAASNVYRLAIALAPLLLEFTPIEGAVTSPLLTRSASLILGLWLIVKPLVEAVGKKTSLDLHQVLKEGDFTGRVAAARTLGKHLRRLVTAVVGKRGLVAVFVDDLDRCNPLTLPTVFEAIRLFATAPQCVYVVGLDEKATEQAVARKYGLDEADSRMYMEKTVQVPFSIPPLDTEKIAEFIRYHYSSIVQACPSAPEVFSISLDRNPRKVKRALNLYEAVLDMAEARFRAWEVDRTDAELLAKMVVLQIQFPAFYRELVLRPLLLLRAEFTILRPRSRKSSEDVDPFESAVFPSDKRLGEYVRPSERAFLSALFRSGRSRFQMECKSIEDLKTYILLTSSLESGLEGARAVRREQREMLSNDPDRVRASVLGLRE
ncbi:MAG TPA: P-loop NTPase fold protein, partial [Methylomirabilota bacterium]|nr:P-loop NTPase fold protein [Methylomirabilota bacterium]